MVITPRDFVRFDREWIEASLPSRFDTCAATHPDRVAVSASGITLRYRDLQRWANRIAHAILARRVGGVTAVVILEQRATLAAGIIGILKAGLAYVPLDSRYPDARLREAADRAEASVVVVDEANAARCRMLFPHLALINVEDLPEGLSDQVPPVDVGPDSNAYIYFTSGSTGRPKGVLDNHRNVLHNVMRYTNALGISPSDRLTLVQTLGFSGAVSSLFCALLNGARVCPVDLRTLGLGRAFAGWVGEQGITVYHSTPSIFRVLVAHGNRFPSVRVVRLEGDAGSVLDVELYRRHFSDACVLVNGLGATETGISRQFFVDRSTVFADGILPIGFPTTDMEVRVVDAQGRVVPGGTTGEIVVRSRYLALGYWRDDELTARAFTRDPDGTRSYRTGDLGRLDSSGSLAYLGRLDARMKVRGQRIDPVEVESAVLMTPGVLEAVATVQPGVDGEPQLMVFITTDNPSPSLKAIRGVIAARVPDSSMPTAFVRLTELPLSENRKIDRRALPPLSQCEPMRDEVAYVAPRTEWEQRIANLWSAILGIPRVGALDHFFELGGDSLKAARFATALEAERGAAIPLSLLLESPTVETLAARIESGAACASPLVALRSRGTRPPLFLFHAHLGQAFAYAALADRLPDDQPVYALQSAAFCAPARPDDNLAVMVDRYLTEIRRVQPHGPYRLGGSCFGGILAFAAAHQLARAGQRCALVALFDVVPPDFGSLLATSVHRRYLVYRVWEKWQVQQRRLAELPAWRWPDALARETVRAVGRRIPIARRGAGKENGRVTDAMLTAAHRRAFEGYRPVPLPDTAVIVLPTAASRYSRDLERDWRPLATNGVHIRQVHADGNGMLRAPLVDELAPILAALLDDASR